MHRSNWTRAALVSLTLAACGDGPAGVELPPVQRVDVGPSASLTAGDTMRLTAYPRAADGTVYGGNAIWRSLDPRVATVTGLGTVGRVRAHAVGTVLIEAEYEGVTGQVAITVVAAPLEVAFVEIVPGTLGLSVDEWVPVEAVAKTADGIVVGGRAVRWTSRHPTIATVDSYGNAAYAAVRGQGVGLTMIRAEVDGIPGEAPVTVGSKTAVQAASSRR